MHGERHYRRTAGLGHGAQVPSRCGKRVLIENGATLELGNRGHTWDLPFKEVFDVLGFRFRGDGKGPQGADRTLCERHGQLARQIHLPVDECIHAYEMSESFSVTSVALPFYGSVSWPRSVTRLPKSRAWEAKILRLAFRPEMYRQRTAHSLRIKWRKTGLSTLADKMWTNLDD